MKKMIVVIIVFLIIISNIKQGDNFSLLNYFEGDYIAYSSTKNNDCVDLGFCYMYTKPDVKNVVGESITIENFEPANALKVLNAKVIKTEYLEDGTTVIYAITNKIEDIIITILGNIIQLYL